LERKYHVEYPKKPINEFVYRGLEMRCYEMPSNFITHVKEKLKDGPPSVCNVLDDMDSFDGIFLEEASSERDIVVTSSESGTELDLSFETASSTLVCQHPDESIRYHEDLNRIFGPYDPYILEIGDIYFDEDDVFNKQVEHKKNKKNKTKKWNKPVEDCRDSKEVIDDNNSQHIIPMEYYAKTF
jgi:hypothetical protein